MNIHKNKGKISYYRFTTKKGKLKKKWQNLFNYVVLLKFCNWYLNCNGNTINF